MLKHFTYKNAPILKLRHPRCVCKNKLRIV